MSKFCKCKDSSKSVHVDISSTLYSYLTKLRIPANLEGYRIIAHILLRHVDEIPECKFTFLYAQVAKELGTTAPRIERALRHTIVKSWERIEASDLKAQLSVGTSTFDPPTVSHYLTAVAYDYRIYLKSISQKEVY